MNYCQILNDTVIKNNYCIGCGVCASISKSPFQIQMNKYGNIIAVFNETNLDDTISNILEICPFSGISKNETVLGDIFFPGIEMHHKQLGKYLECYAGHVTQDDFRKKGSSGGFGKWMGYQLLKEGEIDYFFQVVANQTAHTDEPLFTYQLFSEADEVIKGSKSAYYPVSMVNVIETIKKKEGRYAVIGVPCFIKALRLLALNDTLFSKRLKYTIGIVCGGMKSANQAKMIGWQLGVHPENLVKIDFRRKYEDRPSSQKIYQVWSKSDEKEHSKNANELFGTDYGIGLFKPKACDYCDDVVAETADVTFGDAWIKNYVIDPKGNSLIIVRNKRILEIVKKQSGIKSIKIDQISDEEAVESQIGGFRHRREGLSYRLAKKEKQGNWYPKKRVNANEFSVSKKRKRIYDLREIIAEESHCSFFSALTNNNIILFYKSMNPLLKKYKIATQGRLHFRIYKKVIGRIKNLLI